MLLVIAATEIEMKPFLSLCSFDVRNVKTAISGVGLVEASVSVTRLLEQYHEKLTGVINFGIGGAYLKDGVPMAKMLGVCLAEREFLGDYGVCINNRIEPFSGTGITGQLEFLLDRKLLDCAAGLLTESGQMFTAGSFVTVNGATGTSERGAQLQDRFNGLCENMEGAAIARVCKEYSVPMLEVRAISNLVEDRPGIPWQLKEACEKSAAAAALIVKGFQEAL